MAWKKGKVKCDFCLDGWRYDNPYGWVACGDCNDKGKNKPKDYVIHFWELNQPKVYKIEKLLFIKAKKGKI